MLAGIANVSGSQLLVHGTRNADRVRIESTSAIITVWLNGRSKAFLKARINTLVVGLRQGDDRLDLKTDLPALVHGDGGNDTIVGGSGNDSIYSGSDNDRVYGSDGNDFIDTFDGDDFIAPGAGRDGAQAGLGIDEISYGDRDTGVDVAFEYRLISTAGVAKPIVSECYMDTGPESDRANDVEIVTGSRGDDTLSMVGVLYTPDVPMPDETIHERLYRINGGSGNDRINVDNGVSDLGMSDVVTRQIADAGEGDDTLVAWARGTTTLIGGGGKDSILGSSAGDLIFGEAGDDYLFGSGGVDTLYGNAYDDALDGGEGADYLYGGGGRDRAKADPADVVDSIEVVI